MSKKYDSARIENILDYFRCLEDFSSENVEAVEESVRNMKLEECEPDTISAYLQRLKAVAPLIDFELYNASREQLEELALTINQEDHPDYGLEEGEYSEWSRAGHKSSIQTFFKYFFDDDKEHLFQNIRLTPKSSDRPTVDPEQLIDTLEAEKMLASVSHPRDKAFLALLWDTGMRRKEISCLKWKDIVFQEDGTLKVHVREGKNGPRRLFLYESVPWIASWFEEYPEPEAEDSLWIDLRNHMPKRQISAKCLADIVSKAREKADIPERRKTNLHAWRKARATDLAAKGMNVPAMEQHFGWANGSRMPRIYIQLADVDLENQMRDLYDLEKKKKNYDILGENLEEIQVNRSLKPGKEENQVKV